jgi:RNA polymerase sigma-70 factor (ECF subfamily)
MHASALPLNDSDAALVALSKRGDRGAFARLVHRYQHTVYHICLRMLGDAAHAEEVGQDVFLSVWRALGGFREEARFDTWLRRIAVNKSKNRRVHQVRRKADLHDSVDAPAEPDRPRLQLVTGDRGPDAGVDQRQAAAALQAALDTLEPDHRSVVLLRDMEDLDYDEIADILDIPRGTVKSRLHRARVALARALGGRLTDKDVF